jgi:hypothetical protein
MVKVCVENTFKEIGCRVIAFYDESEFTALGASGDWNIPADACYLEVPLCRNTGN